MATIDPAKVIGKVDKLGTLQVGAPADVSLFEIVEGPVNPFSAVMKKKLYNIS